MVDKWMDDEGGREGEMNGLNERGMEGGREEGKEEWSLTR